MNKRGSEYLSIWWFFALAIIATGIVIGVGIFESAEIGTKEVEAGILVDRSVDCMIKSGILSDEVLNGNINFYKECKLNEEVIGKSEKYYLEYKVFDFKDCKIVNSKTSCDDKKKITGKSFGVSAFASQCLIKGKNYPLCDSRYVYTLDKNGKELIVYIITGSNQEGRWL